MELQIAHTTIFTNNVSKIVKKHFSVSTKLKGSFRGSLNGLCFVISLTDFEGSIVRNDDEK